MEIKELARRVQMLEDIEAIKQLKAEYADACDDLYNPKRMRDLFTQDAVWDGEKEGFGKYVGLDAVCGFFGAAKDSLKFGVHYFLQPRIKIKSETEAEGIFYLVPQGKGRLEDEPHGSGALLCRGHYQGLEGQSALRA